MSYGARKQFYQSKAWKTSRRAIWLKQNCLCAICGRPVYVDGLTDFIDKPNRRTGIVHHKEELTNSNVSIDSIALGEDNLIGVCKECHEQLHHQDVATRKNYFFDEDGNLVDRGGGQPK